MSFELLDMDLLKFRKTYEYDAADLQCVTAEINSAIAYLSSQSMTHLDIKGANILIKLRGNDFFRSYLSDFGLSGARGGSPLHTSPEQLTQAIVEKSDIFALGTTIVKTVCDEEIPLVLISQPIERKDDQKAAADYVKDVPILNLAKRMLKANPDARPDCNEVNKILMTKFPKKEITRKWIEATMTKIKDTVTKINDLHLQKNTKAAAEMTRYD